MAQVHTPQQNPIEQWVTQFDKQDRSAAAFLADSIEYVPADRFQAVLTHLITQQYRSGEPAIALFAIRRTKRQTAPTGLSPIELALRKMPRIYFDPDDKTKRPNAVEPGAAVGSEGPMANLLRDIAADSGGRFLDHPSLNSMYRTKCRRVLMVDDIIGSGTRASRFVDAFYANRFIKSWHSFHYLSFEVFAYAGTQSGLATVQAHKRVSRVAVEQHLKSGRGYWTDTERRQAIDICERYGARTNKPGASLGYKRAFSFLSFAHKCPNTAPAVFWARGKSWTPLFSSRPERQLQGWPNESQTASRRNALLAAIGQPRLASGNWERFYSPVARARLTIIAASAKRIRRPEILSEILGSPVSEVRAILQECVVNGWMSWDHSLTALGLSELEYARNIGSIPGYSIEFGEDLYFPLRLRASRDPV